MKCIPQIRYMAIDKRLELQNCTWSVSMWFQYSVKPPCAAISLYAWWHGIKEALDIFLWNVPPRSLYGSPQSIKSRWRTLTNKSPSNHIPDMFNGQTCLANVQAREAVIPVIFGRRLAQSLPPVARHCPAEICNVELPEGGAVLRVVKPP